jgi:sec-independent protein translocase protein TatC
LTSVEERRQKLKEMTLMEHLLELRDRLKVVLYAVTVSTIAMMALPSPSSMMANPLARYEPLVAWLLWAIKDWVKPAGLVLIGGEVMTPIQLYVVASFVFGVIISSPVIVYEVYKYVDPALYPHERKAVYPFLIAFSVLFILGCALGLLVVLPFVLWASLWFFDIVGASYYVTIDSFYGLVFLTTVLSGVVFTFPAVFVLLVKLGVVSTDLITRNRLYIYSGLLILIMILTPGDAMISNFALWLPLVALTELAVLFAKRYEKGGRLATTPLSLKADWTIRCKFCGYKMARSEVFCPNCGRARE